jgi:uncharacterized membrane protein YgdD (TMEM256/DUF423 family)
VQFLVGSRNHRNYNALVKDDYASSRASGWVGFALVTGGLSGCAGVALDALNAHAFSQNLSAHDVATLATTARYLLIHGLLLMLVAGWLRGAPASLALKAVVVLAATGIVLFCGGLTAKVVSGVPLLGAAAPYGGSAFMAAWLGCAIHAFIGSRPTPLNSK